MAAEQPSISPFMGPQNIDPAKLLPSPGDPIHGTGKKLFLGMIVLVGVLLLGLGGTFLYAKVFVKTPVATTTSLPAVTNTTGDASADADNDGLTGAQEQQYGTNPSNPDTDGDGFKDGEEVSHGYNPNGAGTLVPQARF